MPNEITIQEIENLCTDIANQRAKIEEIRLLKQTQDKELEKLESKMLEVLREIGKDSYKSNVGTIYSINKLTYRTPKTDESRAAFFNYLKEKGVFDRMVTVHSQTLNSWTREQYDIAKQNGETDFNVPGLDPPEMYETIGFRKN